VVAARIGVTLDHPLGIADLPLRNGRIPDLGEDTEAVLSELTGGDGQPARA
jgi:hypothetical protein